MATDSKSKGIVGSRKRARPTQSAATPEQLRERTLERCTQEFEERWQRRWLAPAREHSAARFISGRVQAIVENKRMEDEARPLYESIRARLTRAGAHVTSNPTRTILAFEGVVTDVGAFFVKHKVGTGCGGVATMALYEGLRALTARIVRIQSEEEAARAIAMVPSILTSLSEMKKDFPQAAELAGHEVRSEFVRECLRHGGATFGEVPTDREMGVIAILEGVNLNVVAFGDLTWKNEFDRLACSGRPITPALVIRGEASRITKIRTRMQS